MSCVTIIWSWMVRFDPFDTVRMVYGLFNYSSSSCVSMLCPCHVDSFDSTNLTIVGFIYNDGSVLTTGLQ